MEQTTEKKFNTQAYNFAFLDEGSKRELRRSTLKAIAVPGYQVPFASRELPIARGWGTGGLQLTLSLLGKDDCLKVIDQGHDDSVNAVSIRKLAEESSGVELTEHTEEASLIQTRHRIPEQVLREDQILVLQVPLPEPLRRVERNESQTKQLHAEMEYSSIWLRLYEDIVHWNAITIDADYPCMVHHRYIFNPSPIPRWDVPKLHQAEGLYLFGAGREKKIYAIPPFTDVRPLEFEDYRFETETFHGAKCHLCGSTNVFLDEIFNSKTGEKFYQCSDTGYCQEKQNEGGADE